MIFGGSQHAEGGPSIRIVFKKRYIKDIAVLFSLALILYANLFRLGSAVLPSTVAALSAPKNLVTANQQSARAQPVQTVMTYAATPTLDDVANTVERAQGAPTNTTTSTPTACTGSAYQLPAPIDLSDKPAGLSAIVDAPSYYQVYGSTVSDVRSMIAACPLRQPIGNYQATTSYRLGWQYSVVVVGDGTCRLSNVQVGLHVNQYLPYFSPTASTPSALATHWNSFATSLKTHEDGHVAIDSRYANTLTNALQNLGALDCNSINSQAKLTINGYLAALNAANDLYDAQTNHGATQGAVL